MFLINKQFNYDSWRKEYKLYKINKSLFNHKMSNRVTILHKLVYPNSLRNLTNQPSPLVRNWIETKNNLTDKKILFLKSKKNLESQASYYQPLRNYERKKEHNIT